MTYLGATPSVFTAKGKIPSLIKPVNPVKPVLILAKPITPTKPAPVKTPNPKPMVPKPIKLPAPAKPIVNTLAPGADSAVPFAGLLSDITAPDKLPLVIGALLVAFYLFKRR